MAPGRREKTDAEWAAMTLPRSGRCEVTDTEARMDVAYFEQLLEYSSSLPTGTYIGKRWKARRREGGWWLVEYVVTDSPQTVGVLRRRVMAVAP